MRRRRRKRSAGRTIFLLLYMLLLMGLLPWALAEEGEAVATEPPAVAEAGMEDGEAAEAEGPTLVLKPAEVTIKKGSGVSVRHTVANAPKGVKAKKTEWSSSDPEIANYQNGAIRGLAGGSAVLTCAVTLTDGSQIMAECPVTVTVPVREIRAEVKAITVMAGEPVVPEIQVLPEDATNPALRYSSSDEEVLSIGEDGQILALAEGKASLTVESVDNPTKIIRLAVTVTRRVGVTERELTFQGIPWESDCETCIQRLKEKGIIPEEARSRYSFPSTAWHWPENDLLFSRSSAWRTLPVSFSDRQMGAARTSLDPQKTIGGYLPQISTLIFLNGVDEEGRCDPEKTRLIGVYFEYDSLHERGTEIFNGLLRRLEEQYGAFYRYLQKDIPRYYPEMYSGIQEAMTDAVEYDIQEPGMDVYLGEYAICTIYGAERTGIMLSIDTNETVTLFYGRTDAAEMIREMEEALKAEAPELEDAGV